ncbi:MAG: chromosomal replication initiator protein DnaA [Ignavibacteriae bacterium]|nr:chromosomal replication initiator protein DnaA [Ignavibacteriota bacterium]
MDNLKTKKKKKLKNKTPDSSKVWKEFLLTIKSSIPNLSYSSWFLPLKPISLNGSELKVLVPNDYFVEWIDQHYNTLINNTVEQVLGKEGKLVYIISEEEESDILDLFSDQPEKSVVKSEPKEIVENTFENNLNPHYQFNNYVKGEGNALARAAAIAISENPGETTFNPLFIYGGVGLGKTHLVQAIGNTILSKFPEKKIIYISADNFTTQFVESIQTNTTAKFSKLYNSIDVLIIDDIQFLSGREKTQDLLFHIFNNLHQSRKQIILSSDKPPKEIVGMNERLLSRFNWGLTVDVQPPDFETRIAILKNKSDNFGIDLTNEILDLIAYNITSNIRELEGCLIKLLANSSLTSTPVDFELARKTIDEISTTKREVSISIDNITKLVCKEFDVDDNKVREKNRKKEVVLARQVAMYLSKTLTQSSLKTIGLQFGGRDHSTVIHACNNIEKLASKDMSLNKIVSGLKNKLELGI